MHSYYYIHTTRMRCSGTRALVTHLYDLQMPYRRIIEDFRVQRHATLLHDEGLSRKDLCHVGKEEKDREEKKRRIWNEILYTVVP